MPLPKSLCIGMNYYLPSGSERIYSLFSNCLGFYFCTEGIGLGTISGHVNRNIFVFLPSMELAGVGAERCMGKAEPYHGQWAASLWAHHCSFKVCGFFPMPKNSPWRWLGSKMFTGQEMHYSISLVSFKSDADIAALKYTLPSCPCFNCFTALKQHSDHQGCYHRGSPPTSEALLVPLEA